MELVHNCNFRNEILFRYKPTKIYKSYYLQEGKSPKKQLKIYTYQPLKILTITYYLWKWGLKY